MNYLNTYVTICAQNQIDEPLNKYTIMRTLLARMVLKILNTSIGENVHTVNHLSKVVSKVKKFVFLFKILLS